MTASSASVAPGFARTSRPRRHSVAPLVAVGAVVLLLGAVFGAVWAVTTPAVTGTVTPDGAAVPAEQLGEEFAGVAVFASWMLAYGAIAALLAWFASRYWRGLIGYAVTFVTTVVGTAIAGAIGTWVAELHFPDPHEVSMGQTFRLVPDLVLDGATRNGFSAPWILLICAPLALSLVYLVCALATSDADLGVGDGVDDLPQQPLTAGV
ncbi:DUF2567 domain-containing protein [Gordonia otitidis]|uniref:DUF2567 domain-containing protein n=1 Tax=Gordonia otitidis (strain DSM 44809 / CCUG 52243 / JCM 12355 / NBRC 100426 / IFM 10032) TaxID=1108044 RepID=H5TL88_GORO1|nr:DUF2567 domain-containing protein [Gordonia otitidis]GAB34246.1 hypothetical protein GOOTI_099_00020 [Gordonia otitidis NBRC 100426]